MHICTMAGIREKHDANGKKNQRITGTRIGGHASGSAPTVARRDPVCLVGGSIHRQRLRRGFVVLAAVLLAAHIVEAVRERLLARLHSSKPKLYRQYTVSFVLETEHGANLSRRTWQQKQVGWYRLFMALTASPDTYCTVRWHNARDDDVRTSAMRHRGEEPATHALVANDANRAVLLVVVLLAVWLAVIDEDAALGVYAQLRVAHETPETPLVVLGLAELDVLFGFGGLAALGAHAAKQAREVLDAVRCSVVALASEHLWVSEKRRSAARRMWHARTLVVLHHVLALDRLLALGALKVLRVVRVIADHQDALLDDGAAASTEAQSAPHHGTRD